MFLGCLIGYVVCLVSGLISLSSIFINVFLFELLVFSMVSVVLVLIFRDRCLNSVNFG